MTLGPQFFEFRGRRISLDDPDFNVETVKQGNLTTNKVSFQGKPRETLGTYQSERNKKQYEIETDRTGDTNAYVAGTKQRVGMLTVTGHPENGGEHEIFEVSVHSKHLRQGIASAMLQSARQQVGPVQHSKILSDQGKLWAESEKGK